MTADDMMAAAHASAQRCDLWKDLIRHLASTEASLTILKNAESTLLGTGDLDVLIEKPKMAALVSAAADWSRENGAQCMVCHHVPDGPHIVIAPPGQRHALVVDVKWRRSLFGASLITAQAAQACAGPSPLGPMQLTSGAEALVKLCLYGIDHVFGLDYGKLDAKYAIAGLRADPEGAARAAELMNPPTRLLLKAIGAAVGRRPGRLISTVLKTRLLMAASIQPRTGLQRLYYKAFLRRRCPIMTVVKFGDRRIPADQNGWFSSSKAAHPDVAGYHDPYLRG